MKTTKRNMLKYPPHRNGEVYRDKWYAFLPHILARENFSESHLTQLNVLCGLYEEFENLTAKLQLTGYSYENITSAGGITHKSFPEVAQLNTCRSQIAVYTRMLGLMLVKDVTPISNNSDQEGSWD